MYEDLLQRLKTALLHRNPGIAPALIADLQELPGRSFRATSAAFAGVYDNLSIANMEFSEFADAVDPDEIFREFPA